MANRLDRVERENRRTKLVVLIFAVVTVALLLMGQATDVHELTTQNLVIRGENGVPRWWLGVDEEGNARLEMYDAQESERAALRLFEGDAVFVLGDANRVERIVLGLKKGDASLALHDANGNVLFKAP